ncbi:transporter substrate-binding domain-containing protein [Curvibacter sp. CHRR-16]|uniref:methyl-accepting chemotaxis protein n=1 Tax=Curvibacter sp. CHRR-16 TaxID=2835872 RepID=UPI001BDB6725|nr:methyl-accepting chemotaxis protein [Curvibacter sp. CHRR-16]MBT0571307.1 transporter substrate-binding domain-containing protein [Curvibacter sp. CHRR-16]
MPIPDFSPTPTNVSGRSTAIWGTALFVSWLWLLMAMLQLHSVSTAPAGKETLAALESAWTHATVALFFTATLTIASITIIRQTWLRSLGATPAAVQTLAQQVTQGHWQMSHAPQPGLVATGSAMASLQTMQNRLADLASEIRSQVETVATETVRLASNNLEVANSLGQQSELLQQGNDVLGHMQDKVRMHAAHAKDAQQSISFSTNVAEQGTAVVHEMTRTMDALSESSGKINDIIGVIDGIAFQTNILALNAAVEAARAGEQGKGFAVVASEVRHLAQRSASAAKEIKALITDSVQKIAASAKLADQVSTSMDEIAASSRQVTQLMDGITSSNEAQTQSLGQLREVIHHLDAVNQNHVQVLQQAINDATQLQEYTQQLRQAAAHMQVAGLPSPDQLPALPVARATRPLVAKPIVHAAIADHSSRSAASTAGVQIKVVTAHEPPFNFTDSANKNEASGNDVKGFSPDVVREILKRTGHKAELEITSWERTVESMKKDPNVALYSMARTPTRENVFAWVGPLVNSNSILYVKKGSGITIKSLYDARKLPSIGVLGGDSKEQFLVSKDFTNLDYSNDWPTIFRKLLDGKVTAITMTDTDLPVMAREAGLSAEDFEPACDLFVTRLFIGMSKATDPAVVRSWQDALDAMKQDGTFAQLAEKWAKHWKTNWVVRNGAIQAG